MPRTDLLGPDLGVAVHRDGWDLKLVEHEAQPAHQADALVVQQLLGGAAGGNRRLGSKQASIHYVTAVLGILGSPLLFL